MMVDRPNPIDLPDDVPPAICPECGWGCDVETARELDGQCYDCGELLERENAD